MKNQFDINANIVRRATVCLELLLKRGNNARDFGQARKYAMAAASWETKGSAVERMWREVAALCSVGMEAHS